MRNRRQQLQRQRRFNKLIESTVRRVLREAEEEQSSGSGNFNEVVQNATKLGQVDVEKAKGLLQIKDADSSDAIQVGGLNKPAKDLLPTQSSMNLGKAVHFALGMLNGTMYGSGGPGGDLGAFTCGEYLLDGHHRWVATCMVAPGENVQGYNLEGINAEDAVRVLNVATAAVMGHNKGKPGEGSFADFHKPEKILEKLKAKDVDEETDEVGKDGKKKVNYGVPNTPGPGKATEICEKWAAENGSDAKGEEALKWAAQKMADNCKECKGVSDSAVLIQSNVRADMPVADDPEHAAEVGGDIEPGFEKKGEATKNLIKTFQAGGIDLKESIDLERWNRLAGTLLKD